MPEHLLFARECELFFTFFHTICLRFSCLFLSDPDCRNRFIRHTLFISTQKEPACLLGGMADITIVRDPVSDALSIRNADLVPLVTHYNHDQNIYTVYKLSDYTEELAASHGVHAESTEPFTLETLQEQYKKVLTQDYHTLG